MCITNKVSASFVLSVLECLKLVFEAYNYVS